MSVRDRSPEETEELITARQGGQGQERASQAQRISYTKASPMIRGGLQIQGIKLNVC